MIQLKKLIINKILAIILIYIILPGVGCTNQKSKEGKIKNILKLTSESGFLIKEIEYVNDTTSRFRTFYDNGSIKDEWTTINSKQQGVAKSFYLSGKLKEISMWEKDKSQGSSFYYYENGVIKEYRF